MTLPSRTQSSDYMNFAKLKTAAKYNLASSGVADCVLADLGASMDDLALHGPSTYGYGPLMSMIAGRFQVPAACVVMPGGGCSFANHLAMAALIAPGDEVLIEDPTYELLTSALGYFQARVSRFERKMADDWRVDVDRIAGRLTSATRLVVLTNPHNPTSALSEIATISAVAAEAAKVGAMVLVDEVYLELMFRDGVARTAFSPEANIVVTSSLTKAYGLSGLRCGWILAPPTLAEKMRRLNDLFGVAPPHIAERLAVVALGRLEALRDRANRLLDTNRAAYREILGGHPALDQVVFDQGTTVFPRLRAGDGDSLLNRLSERFETSLVPGRFFGHPDHIRVGLGGDTAGTRAGLERLADALAEG
jgi:aspartate/methionine/tyrosine aminotransferase